MRKVWLVGSVVMLIAVVAVAGFAGARADTPDLLSSPEAVAPIIFDGYCDGMTVSFSTATGITTAVYNSWCCTCPSDDNLGGFVTYNLSQGSWGFPLAWETLWGAPSIIYTTINTNHTWAHYYFDGSLMNSGTWSICSKKAPEGLSPSTGLR